MMQKVDQVESLFREMDAAIAALQEKTNMVCPAGCVLCCLKPDMEVNVLECLPLAWHLVTSGLYEAVVSAIENGAGVCVCLNQQEQNGTAPGCRFYSYRPAICRLFGSSAIRNRREKTAHYYACKTLKDKYAPEWATVQAILRSSPDAPEVTTCYLRLHGLDPVLARDYNPVNRSILKAIAFVMPYITTPACGEV